MSYLKTKTDPNKVSLFFVPTGEGPCRLGQYCKALEQVLTKNKISNECPVGDALIGKKVGDKVSVNAPGGKLVLEIIDIHR